MTRTTDKLRCRERTPRQGQIAAWLVLLALLVWPQSAQAQSEAEADARQPYVDQSGAQALYDWARATLPGHLPELGAAGVTAERHRLLLTFPDSDSDPRPEIVVRPKEADGSDGRVAGDSRLLARHFTPLQQTALAALLERSPPPQIWTRPEPQVLPDLPRLEPISPRGYTWWTLPIFIAWFGLLIWLLRRWYRAMGHIRPPLILRVSVLLAMLFGALYMSQAYNGFRSFDMDAERDLANAQLIASGVEIPLRGPAIHSSTVFTAPLHHVVHALIARVTDLPEALTLANVLSIFLTLLIGAAFMYRAFGATSAIIFAFFWVGTKLPLLYLGFIGHNHLAYPLVATLLWSSWDMWRSRDGDLLPLTVLLIGLSVQFFAIYLPFFPSLALLLLVGRIRLTRRQIIAAFGLLVLTQLWTIGLYIHDHFLFPGDFHFKLEPEGGATTPFAIYLERLWDLIAGIYPFESLGLSLLVALALLVVGLKLSVPRWRPGTPTLRALGILAIYLGPALVAATITHVYFLDYFMAVFLPTATMLVAAGGGFGIDWFVSRNLRYRRFLQATLLSAFLVYLLLNYLMSGQRLSRDLYERGLDLRLQRGIVETLIDHGVRDPDVALVKIHGRVTDELNSGMGTLIRLLSPCDDRKPLFPDFWVAEAPIRHLGPDAMVLGTSTWRRDLAIIGYRSQLDVANARVSAGPDALKFLKSRFLRVPYRRDKATRSVHLYRDGGRPKAVGRPVVERADLADRMVWQIPVMQGFSRPVRVSVSRPCPVNVWYDGRPVHALGLPIAERGVSAEVSTYPRPERPIREIKVETAPGMCRFELLDVFDLPLETVRVKNPN